MKSQKALLAQLAADVVGIDAMTVQGLIEYPPQLEMGDLALPCFRFAQTLRRSPQDIASELAAKVSSHPGFASAVSVGGYVNVKLTRQPFARTLLDTIHADVTQLFSRKRGTGQRFAVDYSSPNIAKPFGVGHLRSTMIGQSIVRMLTTDGAEVFGVNHLGDWGTQFGKNITAYLRWGDEEVVKQNPVKELFHLYVRFHEEAQTQPELEDEARSWFKKLEDGDPEATRLWQWFIAESLKAFQQTYALLGVSFDHYLGESFYNDKMQGVVDELGARGLLVESEGAEVVDLTPWNMPPCIIRKSDGATIYATRDLAAALYRHDALGATNLVYVVGGEQKLHFAQVFQVLRMMGRDWADHCTHVAFGMMKYNGERLSTRRGKVVYLEDVLDKAVAEARAIIEQKNPALPEKAAIARAVGVGAVVFNDLKTYRMHDVDFRFEDVLNFDGETGPYVQYTHARACSVLRKAEQGEPSASWSTEFPDISDTEWNLLHLLGQTNDIFERAVDSFDPSLIARLVLDVCHAFNRFYHDEPILSAPGSLRAARLSLTAGTRDVIAYALYLLGLEAPEAM